MDAAGTVCDAADPTPVPERTGVACTEVALNPTEVAAALEDTTVFPTPVTGTEGPDWIAIGTEGGFLRSPGRNRRKTFYYRVLAFTETHQSGWSPTAQVTTP